VKHHEGVSAIFIGNFTNKKMADPSCQTPLMMFHAFIMTISAKKKKSKGNFSQKKKIIHFKN